MSAFALLDRLDLPGLPGLPVLFDLFDLFDLFALQFAQASVACVAVGLALLLLLQAVARRWPALQASRAPWLLAQALCVLALGLPLLLALAPQAALRGAVPVLALPAPAHAATDAAIGAGAGGIERGRLPGRVIGSPSAERKQGRAAQPDPIAASPGFVTTAAPGVLASDRADAASIAASIAESIAASNAAPRLARDFAPAFGPAFGPTIAPTFAPTFAAAFASNFAPSFAPDLAPDPARHGAAAVAPARASLPPAAFVSTPPSAGALAWLLPAARIWCGVYLAGLLLAVHRQVAATRCLRAVLALAVREAPACAGALPVYRTTVPLPPMLVGVCRPVLLLPPGFDALDPLQRELIVEHERTHWRRRDPLWRTLASVAQVLCWFNPALARLRWRLDWAQEAGCDRAVLARRSPTQRRIYAVTLLAQWRQQQALHAQYRQQRGSTPPRQGSAAMAFGDAGSADAATSLAARMRLIRDGAGAVSLAARMLQALAAVVAVVAVAGVVALQPAYAWQERPAAYGSAGPAGKAAALKTAATRPMATVGTMPAAAPVHWQSPLARMRVTSLFGVVSPLRPQGHHGIDLVARRGTPVLAAADGVVETSADLDAGGAKYGKTISIAHADGRRSFYAHLDSRQVAAGDPVRAGQPIGRSGATGKVSGPHLHFELREAGRPVDPALVLDLRGHATAAALRRR